MQHTGGRHTYCRLWDMLIPQTLFLGWPLERKYVAGDVCIRAILNLMLGKKTKVRRL